MCGDGLALFESEEKKGGNRGRSGDIEEIKKTVFCDFRFLYYH